MLIVQTIILPLVFLAPFGVAKLRRQGWLGRLVAYHKKNFIEDLARLPLPITVTVEKAPAGYVDHPGWDFEAVLRLVLLIEVLGAEPARQAVRSAMAPSRRHYLPYGLDTYKLFPSWSEFSVVNDNADTMDLSEVNSKYGPQPFDEDTVVYIDNALEAHMPSSRITIKKMREVMEREALQRRHMATTTTTAPSYSFTHAPSTQKAPTDAATGPSSETFASQLLLKMDEKVDPCDDFYEFSCGSFLQSTRIPDDKRMDGTNFIIIDQLQEQIRALLDEPIAPQEPRPFALAKTLYQACMKRSTIETRGTAPLLDMLRRLGGWPVLDGPSWNENAFSWEKSVYKLRAAGYSVDYFFVFSIEVDLKNTTKRIINLDQASLGLNREYLARGLSDKLVQAYYDYMVDIAVLLGADRTRAQNELKESLQFEMKIANISLPLEKQRNATSLYNPMTIAHMQEKYPKIPWLEYINNFLAPHTIVGKDEIAIVKVPKYFSELEILLENTPKRVQANYVMWRVAEGSVSYLTETLRRRRLIYDTALTGKTERESRWKECTDTTSDRMRIAVGAMYIRKYFDENSKANALEIVNDIRQQFRKTLDEVEWMDDKTRRAALDKVDAMASHIAYPSEMLDDNKLIQFYSGLEISSDKLMESVLNLTLFDREYLFGKLREPVNKTDWVTHGRPAMVEAFYFSFYNCIILPAGILQGNFFSAKRPAYMNYGAIGYVIGHEITHGFDDEGRQYDKNGNIIDWWQESTKQEYLKKAKCIIDQYSNYTVEEVGMKLNGVNTQGENIADNGGIKEAYYAYLAWSHRHGEEQRLPGLEKYTPRQLFWLSAANTWCQVWRNEAVKVQITTGVHSPGRFRVIGSLSNMEEFAEDFNCPLGSPMNPANKCKVW